MILLTSRHGRNVLTIVATLACAALVHSSSDLALECAAGLPLILFLPGTALVSAVDPFGHQVWGVPRMLWSVGASVGSVILGGLLLNVSGGLTANNWLVLVTGGVVVLGGVSSLRVLISGAKHTDSSAASEPEEGASAEGVPAMEPGVEPELVPATSWPLPRLAVSLRQWLLLVVAVGIGVGTVALSQHSVAVASRERFVQAWIIPQPVNNPWSRSAQIGVHNLTGSTQTALVTVVESPRKGGTPTTFHFSEVLAQAASWTHLLAREPGEPVRVTVTLAQAPTVVVSSVNLANPAN